MKDFHELLNKLEKKFEKSKKSFYPYIEYIKFPKYKLLEKDAELVFDFPIMLLVGKNGANKTSILQALYGSPEGRSVGEYWFTTDVDVIEDDKGIDRQCFIYGYYHEKAQKNVEVLKTRIKNDNNPEYWEPARPQKSYGMTVLEDYKSFGSSYKTRWDTMKKEVVYCDCKEYISAYDLFFYHHDFRSTKKQRTRQDFIRSRSTHLAKALKEGLNSQRFYGRERIKENISANSDICDTISKIMGEQYSEIKIITHSFYNKNKENKPSKTILIKKNDNFYSEAFAGTGEARIILLVNDILNAPEKSLLLIDEPEISLHPGAVYRFKKFLLEQSLEKNHQIIITTHSVHMVEGFPEKAIRVVSKLGDTVKILEGISYQDSFYELGYEHNNKKTVYVEDNLAKYIIDYIIEQEKRENFEKNINVIYLSGGADLIIKHQILAAASQGRENCLFLLDGDKKIDYGKFQDIIKKDYLTEKKIDIKKIPENDFSKLGNIINTMAGVGIDIKASNDKEILKIQKEFIKFWSEYVDFFPYNTPENFLMDLDDDLELKEEFKDKNNKNNGKEYFKNKTQKMLNSEKISGDDILHCQRLVFSKITNDNSLYKHVVDLLKKLSNNPHT